MKVRWTSEAVRDRLEVMAYIAADNPQAAIEMDGLFGEAADRLARYPELGAVGRVPGTRELIPHRNFRLVYEIDGDTLSILALVHAARQWPPTRP